MVNISRILNRKGIKTFYITTTFSIDLVSSRAIGVVDYLNNGSRCNEVPIKPRRGWRWARWYRQSLFRYFGIYQGAHEYVEVLGTIPRKWLLEEFGLRQTRVFSVMSEPLTRDLYVVFMGQEGERVDIGISSLETLEFLSKGQYDLERLRR